MLNTWEIKQTAPLKLEKQTFKYKDSSTSLENAMQCAHQLFTSLMLMLFCSCSELSLIISLTRLAGAGVALVVITPRRLSHLPLLFSYLHVLHQPGHVSLRVPDHPHPRP